MWVMGEKLEGRNKEISKEAIRITQVRENDGLNQGDSSTDSRNALGHVEMHWGIDKRKYNQE